MNVEEWRSQIKRGTLEYCVLLMIARGECYGYELLSRLEKHPILTVTESTIYPLLRRLLREGYLTSTWRESAEGLPPRKYYTITPNGREYLEAMKAAWAELTSAIEEIQGE